MQIVVNLGDCENNTRTKNNNRGNFNVMKKSDRRPRLYSLSVLQRFFQKKVQKKKKAKKKILILKLSTRLVRQVPLQISVKIIQLTQFLTRTMTRKNRKNSFGLPKILIKMLMSQNFQLKKLILR